MPLDPGQVSANNLGDRSALAHGSAVVRYDRRTKLYRRRQSLIAAYVAALGGWNAISVPMRLKVEVAAEMRIVSEFTRARYFVGDPTTADDVVRTANQAARAERALGIGNDSKQPTLPALAEYLAARQTTGGAK